VDLCLGHYWDTAANPALKSLRYLGSYIAASWDARRLARRLACRVISAFTRVFDARWQAQRVPLHPNVSRRSAHPSFGVSEAKMQDPDANAPRERGGVCVCVLEIVRPGMEDSESAEKQENTGIGPASAWRDKLRTRPTPSRVPDAVQRERQRSGAPLIRGTGATATCRARQRPSRIQVAARLPTRSKSPINPPNTGSTPMPRTTL